MSITGQTSERTARRYLAKRRDRSLQATSAAVASALGDLGSEAGMVQAGEVQTDEPGSEVIPVNQSVQSNVQITGINQENLAARFSFHNCTFNSCTFD